jgi:hypothetical protein
MLQIILLSLLDIGKRTTLKEGTILEAIKSTNKQLQIYLKCYRAHRL